MPGALLPEGGLGILDHRPRFFSLRALMNEFSRA